MDYDTVELLVGAALAFIPVIVLFFAGLWCLKNARTRMPIYVVAGLLASLAYGRFAAHLAFISFPPPLDPSFENGGGLDLRGMILLFGAMVGCAAGLITTVVFGVLSLLPQLRRKRAGVRGSRVGGSTGEGSTGKGSTGAGHRGEGSRGKGSTGAGHRGEGSRGKGSTGAGHRGEGSRVGGSTGAGHRGEASRVGGSTGASRAPHKAG